MLLSTLPSAQERTYTNFVSCAVKGKAPYNPKQAYVLFAADYVLFKKSFLFFELAKLCFAGISVKLYINTVNTMAIFHLNVKVLSRSKNQNSIGKAAYICGLKLRDEKLGKTYNYSKKNVDSFFTLLPTHAPTEWADPSVLWNEVERKENRKNSQLARDWVIALPNELNNEQNTELAKQFIQEHLVDVGMCATAAIHFDDANNPHLHILTTLRPIDPETNDWGAKRKGNANLTDWNSKEFLQNIRKQWASKCNEHLALHNHDARISHLTLKEQGIDRKPTKHLGKNFYHSGAAAKPTLDIEAELFTLTFKLRLENNKRTQNSDAIKELEDKIAKLREQSKPKPVEFKFYAEQANDLATEISKLQDELESVVDDIVVGGGVVGDIQNTHKLKPPLPKPTLPTLHLNLGTLSNAQHQEDNLESPKTALQEPQRDKPIQTPSGGQGEPTSGGQGEPASGGQGEPANPKSKRKRRRRTRPK